MIGLRHDCPLDFGDRDWSTARFSQPPPVRNCLYQNGRFRRSSSGFFPCVVRRLFTLLTLIGCSRRIWFGWVSCSLFPISNQSQPTKNYLLWEKMAQTPLFTYFFLGWVGLGLGSSSVSYYYLYVFQPNMILVHRKHPTTLSLAIVEKRQLLVLTLPILKVFRHVGLV